MGTPCVSTWSSNLPERRRPKVPLSRTTNPGQVKAVRAARATAEAWYQMIRHWRVHTVDVPAAPIGSPDASKFKVAGIGDYTAGRGGGYGGLVSVRRLLSPSGGWYEEGDVARALAQLVVGRPDLAGRLGRIRSGAGLQTLLREGGGWAYPRETSIGYALAALALGQHLGDRAADECVRIVQVQLRE